jgi:hypothetical protein
MCLTRLPHASSTFVHCSWKCKKCITGNGKDQWTVTETWDSEEKKNEAKKETKKKEKSSTSSDAFSLICGLESGSLE